MKENKRTYFDYASTTPLDDRVRVKMEPFFASAFGNPGSMHSFGQEASRAVFLARQELAKETGTSYEDVIFTSGATEANHLFLHGVFRAYTRLHPHAKPPHIILSSVEHESVRNSAEALQLFGVEISYAPVSKTGVLDIDALQSLLRPETIAVSVMYGQNEIGTIEPLKKISNMLDEFRKKNDSVYPFFHTDAVQALQYVSVSFSELSVSAMTLSAHKIYGPKGVGALVYSNLKSHKDIYISPVSSGGGQEFGFRGGTENVPGIVGFGEAIRITSHMRDSEYKRISMLQEFLWKEILKIYPRAKLNGPRLGKGRLPNNLHVRFPGISAEDVLIALDLKGFALSAGAACSARALESSHVMRTIRGEDAPLDSIRITFGRQTTKAECKKLVSALKQIFKTFDIINR